MISLFQSEASKTNQIDVNNPLEVIVYIIVPVVMLLVYIFLRKKRKSALKNKTKE